MKTPNENGNDRHCAQPRQRDLPEENPAGRVLIVEDETELAEVLEFNLRQSGYATFTAHDGLSACRLIGSEAPEVILLDLMLPDLDGWEISRMVRSHPDPNIARIPIIMLTAMDTHNDRVRGIESGADLYLSKPYSVKEVLLQVRQIIPRQRHLRHLEEKLDRLQVRMDQELNWQQMLFHELRNQLLLISGYSFRLDKRQQELTPEKSQEYLQIIGRSSDYLNTLAQEFMLIRQVESEHCRLPASAEHPAWLAREIVDHFRPFAVERGKQLKLHCANPHPLSLNRTGFKLILSNLLENAIKYSDPGTRIDVHLESRSSGLELRVEDDGPGIGAEELEKIFHKFYRSPRVTEKLNGTGLGLYTARTLAVAMGGELHAENLPTGGASLVLRLAGA